MIGSVIHSSGSVPLAYRLPSESSQFGTWQERAADWNFSDVLASKSKTIKLACKAIEPFVPRRMAFKLETLSTFRCCLGMQVRRTD